MRLEGIVYLKNSITVDAECLDEQFSISVSGFDGILATPTLDPEFKTKDKDRSFARYELLAPKGLNSKIKMEGKWGVPFSWPKGDSSLEAFGFWFDIKNEEQISGAAKRIYAELSNWIELLKDNLSILSGQDLSMARFGISQVLLERTEKRELYISKESKLIDRYFPPQNVNVIVDQKSGVTLNQLSDALNLTNENKHPLLELELLREAKQALITNNLRKSILDSATALELCLINTIRSNLDMAESLKNEILKNYNSIAKKRQLLKAINVLTPYKTGQESENRFVTV
ncbi:MAG TPA: hypothetical protein PLJ60_07480, partial [Chryseolinea sp.]|nr:hypothetical protein [Chryseolinea sp.]HPM30163.1 hypothetical protein [Chryseolinea sp.]